MKRSFWILIAALLVFTSLDVSGQRWKLRRYELDIYAAGVAFHGDIGLADRPLGNMFNGFRPSFGVSPSFLLRQDLAVSLDLAYLMYGGKDDSNAEHGRIYSFNTHAFQHFVRLEYTLVGVQRGRTGGIYNRRGMINNFGRVQVFIFGGAGGVLAKPKVTDTQTGEAPVNNPGYDPSWVYTAGFPVGAGIKIPLDPRWSFGVDLGYQFTLSDYLDGYKSQWSEYNDSYYLLTFKAIMRIRNDRNGRPVFTRYYR